MQVKSVLLWTALLVTPAAWGEQWQIDYDASRVGFVATYDAVPFDAKFREFDADIRFDSTNLEQASFVVKVKIESVDSESADRDEGMLEADWFKVAEHPVSTFRSTAFHKLSSAGTFSVSGELTIKGTSQPVEFVFNWETADGVVRMQGQSMVKRTDFSIGAGDWAEDDTIGFDVQIVFDLKLTKKQ